MFNYTQFNPAELEYVDIVPVADLPSGERLFVEIEGRPIVIFNIAGKFFAIGDVCTHDNGPLGDGDLEENEIICPRHGARFDLQTGEAKGLPAVEDIPAYPVRVVGDMLQVGIPKA